jgi:hypothetical protein
MPVYQESAHFKELKCYISVNKRRYILVRLETLRYRSNTVRPVSDQIAAVWISNG